MNDNLFRIIAAIIFVIGAGISIYHRRKADRESGEKVSLKDEGLAITISLRLIGLLMWGGILAFLINPAWMYWSKYDIPNWLRWVGVLLGVIADGLAYWIFSSLGNNVSPTVATRTNHTLVNKGPYRWVRHPLYAMGMIAIPGYALLAENWFILLMSLLGFIVLLIRIPKEENKLVEKFGESYIEYRKSTGMFLPKIFG